MACPAHSRCSVSCGCCYHGGKCGTTEGTAGPCEGWREREGGEREGKGCVEGESRAEQGEGGGHSCAVYQWPPAVPISPISTRHFCLGWPPSPLLPLSPHCQLLFLASSSFLPLIGQKKGTGSSCLAQQPPYPIGWTGGRGVWLRAQALLTDRLGSSPPPPPPGSGP